jgi:RNA polymerase sigma factor (sigma-70 family)
MAEAVRKLKTKTITRIELDDLSQKFFPLAQNIARRFAPRGREDDYVSAGYFGISHALLHAADKMYDDDLEKWVKSCIYRFIRRHVVTDHLVCVPNTTLRDAQERGEPIAHMKRHSLGPEAEVPRKTNRYEALKEALETVAVEYLDRQIIELRLEGLTDEEVAEKLGKSKSDIHRRRMRLKARFEEFMGE